MGGAGSGEENLRPETLDGCELDEPGDTGVKVVEGFVSEDLLGVQM